MYRFRGAYKPQKRYKAESFQFGAGGGARTPTMLPSADFESLLEHFPSCPCASLDSREPL